MGEYSDRNPSHDHGDNGGVRVFYGTFCPRYRVGRGQSRMGRGGWDVWDGVPESAPGSLWGAPKTGSSAGGTGTSGTWPAPSGLSAGSATSGTATAASSATPFGGGTLLGAVSTSQPMKASGGVSWTLGSSPAGTNSASADKPAWGASQPSQIGTIAGKSEIQSAGAAKNAFGFTPQDTNKPTSSVTNANPFGAQPAASTTTPAVTSTFAMAPSATASAPAMPTFPGASVSTPSIPQPRPLTSDSAKSTGATSLFGSSTTSSGTGTFPSTSMNVTKTAGSEGTAHKPGIGSTGSSTDPPKALSGGFGFGGAGTTLSTTPSAPSTAVKSTRSDTSLLDDRLQGRTLGQILTDWDTNFSADTEQFQNWCKIVQQWDQYIVSKGDTLLNVQEVIKSLHDRQVNLVDEIGLLEKLEEKLEGETSRLTEEIKQPYGAMLAEAGVQEGTDGSGLTVKSEGGSHES